MTPEIEAALVESAYWEVRARDARDEELARRRRVAEYWWPWDPWVHEADNSNVGGAA